MIQLLYSIVLGLLLYGIIFRDIWVAGVGIIAGIIVLSIEKFID